MKKLISIFVFVCSLTTNTQASTLLSDSFQTNDLSTNWQTVGSANIVSLASDGYALGFSNSVGGGDLFSQWYSSSTNTFTLSFEYQGFGAGGGYVGLNNNSGEWWIFGDGNYGTPYSLSDNTGWNSYSVTFTSNDPIQIKLEEWDGQNHTPNQALFRNLVLTDGTPAVPEPETYLMFAIGLLGIAIARKKAHG